MGWPSDFAKGFLGDSGTVGGFLGGAVGGPVGSVIGQYAGGALSGALGMNEQPEDPVAQSKRMMDTLYPGTNAWERLGSSAGGATSAAGIAAREKSRDRDLAKYQIRTQANAQIKSAQVAADASRDVAETQRGATQYAADVGQVSALYRADPVAANEWIDWVLGGRPLPETWPGELKSALDQVRHLFSRLDMDERRLQADQLFGAIDRRIRAGELDLSAIRELNPSNPLFALWRLIQRETNTDPAFSRHTSDVDKALSKEGLELGSGFPNFGNYGPPLQTQKEWVPMAIMLLATLLGGGLGAFAVRGIGKGLGMFMGRKAARKGVLGGSQGRPSRPWSKPDF